VLQDARFRAAQAARDLRLGDGQTEGQRTVRRDHRVAEEVRRARSALGPLHLRRPPDGIQLLLRSQEDAGKESLIELEARGTIRAKDPNGARFLPMDWGPVNAMGANANGAQ